MYKRECYQDLKNRLAGHYFPMVTKWFQIAELLGEIFFEGAFFLCFLNIFLRFKGKLIQVAKVVYDMFIGCH